MGRTCCVVRCKSRKQTPRHKFPKDPVRCHEWIKSLNLHFLENVCANDLQKYRVCYKHFREEDYSCSPHNRVLCNTAIPVVHISNNHDNEMCSSMLTEISHVQEQMQHQLAEQQNLLETYHAEQTQLQNRVYEIEQKISDNDITEKNDLQQFYYEHTNREKEEESIIHEHEKRLNKIEEQLTSISQINKLQLQRRPNLQCITRKRNLSPTARTLYNTTVKLRRTNTRLKRLMKQQKVQHIRKVKLHNTNGNEVQTQFIDMILRNNEVLPQVY